MVATLSWESVSWRCGTDRYTFEIERGGLFATMKAPGNRSLTLPMIVWDGLIDALKCDRAAKTRGEQRFPVRSGSRWYDGEAEELAKAFLSGSTIAALAKAHHRSEYAIEHQLDKLGLISNADKYGPQTAGTANQPPGELKGMHPLDAPLERGDANEAPSSASLSTE